MTIVLQNKLINIIIAILFCKTGNMQEKKECLIVIIFKEFLDEK